jgi:N-acetylglucosaminyldiphosphoundecaprenol N-acetyl-beta-D-mannosaminyltransferase
MYHVKENIIVMRINIAGVEVDPVTKNQTIAEIDKMIAQKQPGYLVTVYSEFVVFAQKDLDYKRVLNKAKLSLPDGIGILWAARYLALPTQFSIFNLQFLKKILCLWQVLYTGAAIIFNPNYIRSVLSEQVTGSHLIWDIAKLASQNSYSLALVGGHNRVAEITALKLKDKFHNLMITLIDSPEKFDDQVVKKIAQSNSDILLIAYQPPRQEKWLAKNIDKLNVSVAIGLGGTFDYIAGKRLPAPRFVHYMGLEWLFRLITQPWRLKRMWNAIPVFIWTVYRFKVQGLKI